MRTLADVRLRQLELPADAEALRALDTHFSTQEILRVQVSASAFAVTKEMLDAPLTQNFPLDELYLEQDGFRRVAVRGDRVIGLVAATHHEWNHRTELRHLYVDGAWRGLGLGRRLLDEVWRWQLSLASRGLWVECQDRNPAAVAFYRSQGFALCGLDRSLYDDTGPGAGEVALFLFKARPTGAPS